MAAKEYLPQLTPLSCMTVLTCITDAWRKVLSQEPYKDAVVLLTAHSAFETGQWGRCPNYNFAGIKAIGDQDYAIWTTHEGDAHPSSYQGHFRAYASKEEGATGFVTFLAKNTRYAKAWQSLANDADPQAYGHLLKEAGYYTGNEIIYCAALKRLWDWVALQALGYSSDKAGCLAFQQAHPDQLTADGIFGPISRAVAKKILRDSR